MITLKQTCGACPEQYDAYRNDKLVGYFRLRHGHFTVNAYGPSGPLVYEASPYGDGLFEYDEREGYLNEGCQALLNYLDELPKQKLFTIEY